MKRLLLVLLAACTPPTPVDREAQVTSAPTATRSASRRRAISSKLIPYVALPAADGHPIESNEARGKGSDSWRVLVRSLAAWQSR